MKKIFNIIYFQYEYNYNSIRRNNYSINYFSSNDENNLAKSLSVVFSKRENFHVPFQIIAQFEQISRWIQSSSVLLDTLKTSEEIRVSRIDDVSRIRSLKVGETFYRNPLASDSRDIPCWEIRACFFGRWLVGKILFPPALARSRPS